MSNLSSHKITDLRYSKHFEVKLSAFTTDLLLFTKIYLDVWRWCFCMNMCLFVWIQICICMSLWMSLVLSYLHWDKVCCYLPLCSLVWLALKIQGFSHFCLSSHHKSNGITDTCYSTRLCTGSIDLNSGPHVFLNKHFIYWVKSPVWLGIFKL